MNCHFAEEHFDQFIHFQILCSRDGHVVISKGALIVAEVAESKEKEYAGQAGRILVSFRTLTAVDGQDIIVSGSSRRERDDKMLESIGLGLVCCPLFLLMKVEEGVIKVGQIAQIYTIQKADVMVETQGSSNQP
jgi:hypothetical protein